MIFDGYGEYIGMGDDRTQTEGTVPRFYGRHE
jgi:hypothetical protein